MRGGAGTAGACDRSHDAGVPRSGIARQEVGVKTSAASLEITAPAPAGCERALTPETLAFVAGLVDGADLHDGRRITPQLVRALVAEELERTRAAQGPERFARGRFAQAHELFLRLCVEPAFTDFLTLPAYEQLEA